MIHYLDGRESDSPLVKGIWRSRTDEGGSFISVAEHHWEMVFTKQYGKTTLSVRGPETTATEAPIPENAEFFGIVFQLGTFMPKLPVSALVDEQLHLPEETHHSVYLLDERRELPTFDNADTFIERLVKQELLVYEPLVEAVLQNQILDVSLRTAQRRFLKATGMPYGTMQQIERAKQAMALLKQGIPILDTVYETGYADQPHLTRSLKRFIGQTPSEITQAIWRS